MSSHSNNPNRGRRPVWWTVLCGAMLVGYVIVKPYFDENGGANAPNPNDERAAATATDQQTAAEGPDTPDEHDRAAASTELTEIRPHVFESPAGLIYGPGSREGHRIDHILRHAADDPGRPVHGVFDGDREEILALLDEAYGIALERGPPVELERDGERSVYTINMGRRVGYVGGESGRRDGHPDATHVRLVLEDRDVITAFPLRP